MRLTICTCVGVFLLAFTANAGTQLIQNGGFESGTLTNWITNGTLGSTDAFFADNSLVTPYGNPTVGPNTGTWYAVSDSLNLIVPESTYLVQQVTIPVGTIDDVFSANIFVNDQFGGSGTGGEIAIWANGANPLTATPLYIIYGPADTPVSGGTPNPYVLVNQDITAHVTAGTTYQIGVLESDSTGPINVGVDDVSLIATAATGTPEPGMLLPMAVLAAGILSYRARRRLRS